MRGFLILLAFAVIIGFFYLNYSVRGPWDASVKEIVAKHRKLVLAVGMMIWLSILCVWGVSTVSQTIADRPVPALNVPSSTIVQNQSSYAVPVDKNTVWVIDTSLNQIHVITHDKDGYHDRLVTMDSTP